MSRATRAGIAAGALALAATCAWQVSEMDIYWQVRAGDELLAGRGLPHQDTWSYAARGAPWLNIQWLSTILIRLIYGLGAEAALVIGRIAAVAGVLGLVGAAAYVAAGAARERPRGLLPLAPSWAAMALTAVALLPRLQLRSDFFVLGVDAGLVLLWLHPPVTPRQARARRWLALAAVAVAANLHAGTAPFVAATAATALCGEPLPWRRRVLWAAGALVATLATPYHVTALPLLWAHVRYDQHNLLTNPDHQPLTRATLLSLSGLAAAAGVALAALAAAAMWRGRRPLPGVLRQPWAAAALVALFGALAVDRIRAIPYLIVPLAPLWAAGLRHGVPRRWRGMVTAAVLVTSLAAMATATRRLAPTFGLTANAQAFPVGSTAFVARERPDGQILHTFTFGAYMVWHLRDYPLYVDTRESPFWPLQPEILAAYASPAATEAVIDKYGVQTVVMPIPATQYVPGVGFDDVTARYMPARDWAMVYFDHVSFVMVRRTPRHAELIARHSYELLRPNLPANAYVTGRDRTAARDRRFAAELARCRRDEPDNAFCLVAEASFWRATDGAAYAQHGVAQLRRAAAGLRPGTQPHFTAMLELQAALRHVGRLEEAAAIEVALGPATVLRG